MSKFFSFALSLLALISIGIGAAGWWMHDQFTKPGQLKQGILVVIPRGAHINGIADLLSYNDVISSPLIFKTIAKIRGKAEKIKAGEYEFAPHISMEKALEKMIKGETFKRSITIREGLTNYEILKLLQTNKELVQTEIDLIGEGRYLPDTYNFVKGDRTGDILKRMQSAMQSALNDAWENRAENLPLESKDEALVLASIVEKETAVASERRRVAGVFINRLRKGMLLQTDPTVIYALTNGKPEDNGQGPLGRRLLKKDLEIDSPYNTYRYPGLPPGPIANPGKASIKAALNPEEHDYIYFVANGTGGHAFAKTLKEHNQNVAKWRKIRKK